MTIRAYSDFLLIEALKEEGFPLPEECREARLIMGVDSVLMMQYDVFLTSENTVKLGKALVKVGERVK